MSNEMRELLDLPIEIIAHILQFCDPIDIWSVSICCKTLYEASTWESIWRTKIRQACDVTELSDVTNCEWTYRDLYQKLLHHYGSILGLWHCQESVCGAIFKVDFDPNDACIRCYEIMTPQSPKIEDPLRRKQLFEIRAKGLTKTRQITCCSRNGSTHRASVELNSDQGFTFKCLAKSQEHINLDSMDTAFSDWIMDEYGEDEFMGQIHGSELWLKRFIAWKSRESGFIASPLELNINCNVQNALIRPGIFKGTYSVHGIEFVQLTYESLSPDKITVRKITGDENVPAGQITNTADLTRPMLLNREQQSDESLKNIDIPDMEPGFDLKALPRQPFSVPHGWRERGLNAPAYCRARFHGRGQIAGTGFHGAAMTPGHWVLFDEDTFGFLWLELNAFGQYSRVKEGL